MDPTILDGVDDLINYETFKLNVFLPLIKRAVGKQNITKPLASTEKYYEIIKA